MGPGRSSHPPPESRVRLRGSALEEREPSGLQTSQDPPKAGKREPWEHLPAHLPVGLPQTDKYLRTTLKLTNQTSPAASPERR